MHLFLHIGSEKTGTTSFQHWCTRNSAALIAQGVLYPQAFGSPAHRHLAMAARGFDHPDDGMARLAISDRDAFDRFIGQHRQALAAETEAARAAGAHSVIISSEHLQSRLTEPHMFTRLHDLLAGLFDDISIILHLRPQVSVMLSLASTAARHGRRVDRRFFHQEAARTAFYDYDALVTRWEQAFSPAAVQLVAFQRESDISRWFRKKLSLSRRTLGRPPRANTALSLEAFSLVNALDRSALPAHLAANTGDMLALNMIEGTERLAIGRQFAETLHAQFRDSNRRLGARRGDIKASDLEPDWSIWPATGNLAAARDPARLGRALASLAHIFHAKLALEAGRTRRTEGEHAIATGHRETAAEFFVLAEECFDKAAACAGVQRYSKDETDRTHALIQLNQLQDICVQIRKRRAKTPG